jgi:hypothetical protein
MSGLPTGTVTFFTDVEASSWRAKPVVVLDPLPVAGGADLWRERAGERSSGEAFEIEPRVDASREASIITMTGVSNAHEVRAVT